MQQRIFGIILITMAFFSFFFVYASNNQHQGHIDLIMLNQDSCFLDDGTCLHQESSNIRVLGYVISFSLLILGLYLIFFDKTQKMIDEYQDKISKLLDNKKENLNYSDKFSAFLEGFNEDEKKILACVKENDGIYQSTLRFKTDLSKTVLSNYLKNLEDKRIIKKKPYKKTNQIYLIKRF